MATIDKDALNNSVDNYVDSLWNKTVDTLKTKMVEEANSKDVSKDLMNTLKENVDLQNYPDDVYYTVMDEMVEINTTGTATSNDIFSKLKDWFEDLIDDIFSKKTKSLIVDGVTYLIAGALAKTTTLAKITVSGVDHILNWTGVTDNDHTVQNFIDEVIDAGTDCCKSLWKEISHSGTGELVTNWIETLVDKNENVSSFISTLKENYADINQDNYKSKLIELTAEVFADNSSTINNLTDKYNTLVEKVNTLKNDSNISAASESYRNFVDSYNDLASALGTSGISYDIIDNFISDSDNESLPANTYVNGDTLTLTSEHSGDIWLGGINYFDNRNTVWGSNEINNIDASENSNAHILAGNENSNVITAGSGSTSMWGGIGGDDTMIGGDSRDYFWYVDGNGNDTAKNFTTGQGENSDVLVLRGGVSSVNRDGDTIIIGGASGGAISIEANFSEDETILYSLSGQNISAAKIASSENALSYDAETKYFKFNDNAGTVYYSGSDDATIALDNSNGQIFIGAKNIQAQDSTGNLNLIGNALDNEIYSGSGNDTLTGGNGADRFYWGNGDGVDIITDAQSDDIIDLYNVSISDVAEIDTSSGINVRLNDGSQLSVNSQEATFQLSSGSRWKYQGGWQRQA